MPETQLIVTVCLVASAALVAAEVRDSPPGRVLFKIVASTAFVVIAMQRDAMASSYGRLILAALVLGWFGDVFLLSRQSRVFLLGLASFLLAHIVFSLAFAHRPLSTPALAAGFAVMSCVGATVLAWLWRQLSGIYRAAVACYVAAIVAMCSFAIAMSAATGAWIVAAGALAFAASDISVARDRFVAPGVINRVWGLPLYYAAQTILALSVGGALQR
ncbi:MAG TPA: lysoplasmalogenase [Steroidobacteraceae bacterium]|jgi:uncharacterized membrane protein YhhN